MQAFLKHYRLNTKAAINNNNFNISQHLLNKDFSTLQGFVEVFLIRRGIKNLSSKNLIDPISDLLLQFWVIFGIFLYFCYFY